MEYKQYKVYDPEISNIVRGIRVADCMVLSNTDENEEIPEDYVSPKIQDLIISSVLSCSFCNVSFSDATEQRSHYKLNWHRYNLKRALCDKKPVSEDVFDSLADEVSSISGSETDGSDKEGSDSEASDSPGKKAIKVGSDSKFTRGRHFKAFFENSDNKIFSVYRCLLCSKNVSVSNSLLISSMTDMLNSPKKWLIVMLGGGHFAAAIFNSDTIAEHKTFHCYTVRAKQGGSQSSRDNKGSGHPKSAGASLRRYNEQALTRHVQEVISIWSESVKQCQLIFYRATGRYNRGVLFGGKNPPFEKCDPRLRNIPFPTRRATFKEINRVHDMLCTLEVYGCADEFKNKYPRSPDKLSSFPKTNPTVTGSVQIVTNSSEQENIKNKKKKTSRKIDRSKARRSPEREIPGEDVNYSSEGDSSHEDLEEKIVLVPGYVDISFDTLEEYDDTVSKHTEELYDTESRRSKSSQKRKKKTKKSAVDRQFESIQRKLVNSCERGDKDLLVQTLKIYDSLPEVIDEENESEKANSMTKEDFINCLNTSLNNENRDTILHLSASNSLPEFVSLLLEAGADPTIKNRNRLTPYVISGSRETKNSFKQFVSQYPDRVDCKKANIPEPLSEEMRQVYDEKKREKNRIKRQKDKIKKKENKDKREEEKERQRFLALSDREKRALAAERRMLASATANLKSAKPPVLSRCFLCGTDITGKVPFEYGMNRFCSVPCVKAHRLKTNSYGMEI